MQITRKETLKLLKYHGWQTTDQTEANNGIMVLKGSSFDEIEGINEEYNLDDVMIWLGY